MIMFNLKRLLPVVLLLFGMATGCRQAQNVQQTGMEEDRTGWNTLTAEEAAAGWKLLFDGKTVDAWRGFKQEGLPKGWVADNGTLYFTGDGGGDIISKEAYESFEMSLDWKISEGGNSGIFFHVIEEGDAVYSSGPEMQVLDNERHPDARAGLNRTAGANYDLHAPAKDVVHPAGEWNSVRLVVDGPHVEHWLNGEKIVEYELWSDDWEASVAASKFNEMPLYGRAPSGHLALQDHGNPVWFRNIKVRRR